MFLIRGFEIAAQCFLGYHSTTKCQYQIQISAVQRLNSDGDMENLTIKYPGYSVSAQKHQLRGSESHLIFSMSRQEIPYAQLTSLQCASLLASF